MWVCADVCKASVEGRGGSTQHGCWKQSFSLMEELKVLLAFGPPLYALVYFLLFWKQSVTMYLDQTAIPLAPGLHRFYYLRWLMWLNFYLLLYLCGLGACMRCG